MRAFVLMVALVLALPLAAAGDVEAEPDAETECVPVFVDAIPPNEVAINPPCAAENIASLMPVGGDMFLCAFESLWAATGPHQQSEGGPDLIHVHGATGCATG